MISTCCGAKSLGPHRPMRGKAPKRTEHSEGDKKDGGGLGRPVKLDDLRMLVDEFGRVVDVVVDDDVEVLLGVVLGNVLVGELLRGHLDGGCRFGLENGGIFWTAVLLARYPRTAARGSATGCNWAGGRTRDSKTRARRAMDCVRTAMAGSRRCVSKGVRKKAKRSRSPPGNGERECRSPAAFQNPWASLTDPGDPRRHAWQALGQSGSVKSKATPFLIRPIPPWFDSEDAVFPGYFGSRPGSPSADEFPCQNLRLGTATVCRDLQL